MEPRWERAPHRLLMAHRVRQQQALQGRRGHPAPPERGPLEPAGNRGRQRDLRRPLDRAAGLPGRGWDQRPDRWDRRQGRSDPRLGRQAQGPPPEPPSSWVQSPEVGAGHYASSSGGRCGWRRLRASTAQGSELERGPPGLRALWGPLQQLSQEMLRVPRRGRRTARGQRPRARQPSEPPQEAKGAPLWSPHRGPLEWHSWGHPPVVALPTSFRTR